MSKVFIWDGGWWGAAQVVASSAVMLTQQHEEKTLLVYTDPSNRHEQGFIKKIEEIPKTYLSEEGITALHRLCIAGRLTPESIENYTIPLIQHRSLQGKLDLASGSSHTFRKHNVWTWQEIDVMIQNADEIYDKVIIHLSGDHEVLGRLKQEKGQLIVVLRQDRVMLDNFFENIIPNYLEATIPFTVVMCNYDHRSKWNLANVKRKYKRNIPMLAIPHCTAFMDAWNEGDIISFFRKQSFLLKKNKQKQSFMLQFDAIAKLIIKNSNSELIKMEAEKGA